MTEAESTIKVRRTTPAARALALLTAFAVALVPTAAVAPTPSRAQSLPPGLPVIRDAEIEQLLRDYTQPILRAAGLAQQNVQVTIINDRSFNAFVMDGRRIFINAGALVDAKVPNEVIGVLAHETGHMAGGHLSRLRQQLANAQAASIIGKTAQLELYDLETSVTGPSLVSTANISPRRETRLTATPSRTGASMRRANSST